MVGCSHDDDVARQSIDLEQQTRDYTLDLAGLVNVAALLAQGIELIEEQNAGHRANIVEQAAQPLRGLTEEAADQGVVPDREEGDGQCLGKGLGQSRLAVPGRTGEEDTMSGLQSVGAQQISSVLLLDQIRYLGAHDVR